MTTAVSLPKMGLTMVSATVGKWLKNVGDPVHRGEELVEVTTDKITNVVEVPEDGRLLEIVAPEGAELMVGDLLGVVGAEGETVAIPAPATVVTPDAAADAATVSLPTAESVAAMVRKPAISPLARRIAENAGLDPATLTGTGPGGRITSEDVEAAIAARTAAAPPPEAVAEAPAPTVAPADGGNAVLRRIPFTGMRRAIGAAMTASHAAVPCVTQHVSLDVAALLALRAKINEDRDGDHRVSLTDLLIRITARALIRVPELNATFDGRETLVMRDVDIGLAIAVDDGLVVPVIRAADRRSLDEIAAATRALAAKARARTLAEADLVGATFTLSNEGVWSSVDHFTPIVALPQVAILGVGRTVETPIAVDGQVVIRPVTGFSLTHDHRVIDGAPAAKFLAEFEKLVANPIAAIV
jgi:pyruvate dehydrogenase E2 component (dihydrolipoamide acetyltransferase)